MQLFDQDEALKEQLDAAVHMLNMGGVVALPTDTSYALSALASDDRSVKRVFELKNRSTDTAIPLLLSKTIDISKFARNVPSLAWDLANHFWPGALTLVLKKTDAITGVVSGGKDTVALRVPANPIPRYVVEKLGAPVTGTSANRSGNPSLTTAADVRKEFGPEIDLVVEGTEPTGTLASTVLDLSGEKPHVLRQGVIPWSEIEELCRGKGATEGTRR